MESPAFLRKPTYWLIVLITLAFAFVPLWNENVELREELVIAAIYIILATNLNLMIGYAGYINFGNIVFFGLGGYITMWLVSSHGWSLFAAALTGAAGVSVLALFFGLGVALACTSGALIATLFPFTVLSGAAYQLKSFVVTVLGGLGNPAGALLGGVALGLLEGAMTPFMPVSWTSVVEFVVFVIVLIAFPAGLFNFRR